MSKVLLIEDDPFLSSLLGNRLKREGFDVLSVKSGNEAVKSLKSFVPDLVLLDLILPGKSGFEVLEEMKADPQAPKVPVVVISNLGQESDLARGRELGAVDYIIKARTTIDDMVQKVRDFLSQPK